MLIELDAYCIFRNSRSLIEGIERWILLPRSNECLFPETPVEKIGLLNVTLRFTTILKML